MIRERFMEHLRNAKNKTKNTPFGDHFKKDHDQHTGVDHTTLGIEILKVCKDVADVKICESIEIRNKKPQLNIMSSSWSLIKPAQYH